MHLARAEAIGLCLIKIIAFRARGTRLRWPWNLTDHKSAFCWARSEKKYSLCFNPH